MELSAPDLIAFGRGYAVKALPYWAQTIYGFVPFETTHITTMSVTPWLSLFYNPKFLRELADPKPMTGYLIAHETAHIRLRHIERGEGVEFPRIYNQAGDLVINPMLNKMGLVMPADQKGRRIGILPEDYEFPEELTTDAYYRLLVELRKKPRPKPPSKPKEEGSGESASEEQAEPGEGEEGEVLCGSCSCKPEEEGQKELQELEAEHGRDPIEVEAIGQVAQLEARKAASDAIRTGTWGDLPGGFREYMDMIGLEEEQAGASIDWTDHLQSSVYAGVSEVKSMQRVRTYRRLSRRSYTIGTIRPSVVQRGGIVPALIMDTSASMGTDDIRKCQIQAIRILRRCGIRKAWWIEADVHVATPPRLVNLQQVRAIQEVHGRGGTDFRHAIAALEKLIPRPNLFVYFTDGYGTAPAEPPPRTVAIWAVVNGGPRPAPWGKLVEIDGPVADMDDD